MSKYHIVRTFFDTTFYIVSENNQGSTKLGFRDNTTIELTDDELKEIIMQEHAKGLSTFIVRENAKKRRKSKK